MRIATLALVWTSLLALTSVGRATCTPAQDGMEEFAEVDPYTRGDRAQMMKLGYVAFAPFPWRDGERTVDVQQNMGGVSMLWVETEHFKIGSSLGTYAIPNDKEEKARLKAEVGRLKKKLGRLKAPRKTLDPWLRLHLYAQRAEELYASFASDFGLAPADFAESGPYLGSQEKFLVLLCARKSEFGRYLKTYLDAENEYSYRWGWPGGGMFWGANLEAIRQSWGEPDETPFDSMLHCRMVSGLAGNFIDGYGGNLWTAPRWLSFAAGHLYVRRVDPRWVSSAGYAPGQGHRDEDWKWESRVANLVKNAFYAKAAEMFAWTDYEQLSTRDHMVAWSKLEYLLTVAEGDRKGLLDAVTRPTLEGTGATVELQTQALAKCFELEPTELDEAWAKWVKKAYKKR